MTRRFEKISVHEIGVQSYSKTVSIKFKYYSKLFLKSSPDLKTIFDKKQDRPPKNTRRRWEPLKGQINYPARFQEKNSSPRTSPQSCPERSPSGPRDHPELPPEDPPRIENRPPRVPRSHPGPPKASPLPGLTTRPKKELSSVARNGCPKSPRRVAE